MRPIRALLPIAVLALAACGSKGGVEAKNESAESVARKVAASDVKPRPGRWETSVKVEKMAITGVPPQLQGAMGKSMGAIQNIASCLTPEQVNRPNAGFFGSHETGCTYQHFTMSGGQIDAEMTCNRPNMQMHMTMKGAYGEDTYAIAVTNEGTLAPGKTMSTSMTMTSHRVGDCTGKENG
jgi:Protein of unknown function (DUF3617)